jgi:predicted Zn finger-like uncharacterized protein
VGKFPLIMQVTCPSCGARYAVDPTAIGPAGRTVQCVRCNHRWREKPVASIAAGDPVGAVPPPPRAPDFVIRPPSSYHSGLPAIARPPDTSHWGRWLAVVLVVVVALGAAAFAYRDEIRRNLPPEWQVYFSLDGIRSLLRQ